MRAGGFFSGKNIHRSLGIQFHILYSILLSGFVSLFRTGVLFFFMPVIEYRKTDQHTDKYNRE